MKFSLWMLYDMLGDFSPQIHVQSPVQTGIENIRLFSGSQTPSDHTLYIGAASAFGLGEMGQVVCMHRQNYIILTSDDLSGVFNHILNLFDQYQHWHQTITEAISRRCMLKDVLDLFSHELPFPLLVVDAAQITLATSSGFGMGTVDSMWDSLLTTGSIGLENTFEFCNLHRDNLTLKAPYHIPKGLFPYDSYCQNLYLNNDLAGFLCLIIKDHPLSAGQQDFFCILSSFIEQWFLLYADDNEIQAQNAVLCDVLAGNSDSLAKLELIFLAHSWEFEAPKYVVVLTCVSEGLNINSYLTKALEHAFPQLYALTFRNDVVILGNSQSFPHQNIHTELRPLLTGIGYYGGVSNVFHSVKDVPTFYQQAFVAARHCPPASGTLISCNNVVLPYAINLLREHTQLELCHPALEMLQQHDQAAHTAYFHILYEYLKHNCNQAQTAQCLHMHRTSLIRKIDRITELTGIDLSDYYTRLHLCLSYEYAQSR